VGSSVGSGVGAAVGSGEGTGLGFEEGAKVGPGEGTEEGRGVGIGDGKGEGSGLGRGVGWWVGGCTLGASQVVGSFEAEALTKTWAREGTPEAMAADRMAWPRVVNPSCAERSPNTPTEVSLKEVEEEAAEESLFLPPFKSPPHKSSGSENSTPPAVRSRWSHREPNRTVTLTPAARATAATNASADALTLLLVVAAGFRASSVAAAAATSRRAVELSADSKEDASCRVSCLRSNVPRTFWTSTTALISGSAG
jgi:hypothetical protein